MITLICTVGRVFLVGQRAIVLHVKAKDNKFAFQSLEIGENDTVDIWVHDIETAKEQWEFIAEKRYTGDPNAIGMFSRNSETEYHNIILGILDSELDFFENNAVHLHKEKTDILFRVYLDKVLNEQSVILSRPFAIRPKIWIEDI